MKQAAALHVCFILTLFCGVLPLYSTKINDVRIEHRAVTIKGSVDGQCEHDPQILS